MDPERLLEPSYLGHDVEKTALAAEGMLALFERLATRSANIYSGRASFLLHDREQLFAWPPAARQMRGRKRWHNGCFPGEARVPPRRFLMRFQDFDQEAESFVEGEYPPSEGFESQFVVDREDGLEMQLATQLLGVSSEQELEGFLAGLLSRAGGEVAPSFRTSPVGRRLGGLLKSAAMRFLPHLDAGFGEHAAGENGPGFGHSATQAGQILGLELEGLTNEDAEFEAARQFVRFARDAARRAGSSTSRNMDARRGFVEAARHHAPGLVGRATLQGGFPRSGRWMRHGRVITLM